MLELAKAEKWGWEMEVALAPESDSVLATDWVLVWVLVSGRVWAMVSVTEWGHVSDAEWGLVLAREWATASARELELVLEIESGQALELPWEYA